MKIKLTNFTSHDLTEVELPAAGLVVVTGANGAGKSALVEAVSTALWGRGTRGARWSGWRKTAGSVVLEDGPLLVERRWTGKAKTLRWTGPGWAAGDAPHFDTASKAQDALDGVVGSFEVWRRACVFSSSDAAHFTLATDAERKELLETLLGLGWFDQALEACRVDLRSAQTRLGLTERERSAAAAGLAQARAALERAAGELGQAPDEAGLSRADLARISGHAREVAAELRQVRDQLAEALQAGGKEQARAEQVRARAARLDGDACYACGQDVGVDLRARMQAEVAVATAEAAEARRLVAGQVTELRFHVAELELEGQDVGRVEAGLREKIQRGEQARAARAALLRLRAASEQEVSKQEALGTTAAELAADLAGQVAELEACERVLGLRGARARMVGGTLSAIEELANLWLARLSSTIVLKLRPYTVKKSGASVDAISLTLGGAGGDGEGEYIGASAGERRRVDVALLMALAELAHNARQAWSSPLFFDEVFDGLDADGRDAVVEVLGELAVRHCVVLITHDERLAAERADLRIHVDAGRIV